MWVFNHDRTALINLDRDEEIRIGSDYEQTCWYIAAGGHYIIKGITSKDTAEVVLDDIRHRLEGRA